MNPNEEEEEGAECVASPVIPSAAVVLRELLPPLSDPLEDEALKPKRVAEPVALIVNDVLEPGATLVTPVIDVLIEKPPADP